MKSNLALAVAMAITVGVTAACAGDRADRERAWETVFRAALAQGRAPVMRCTIPPVICADTLKWQAIGSPEILLIAGPHSSRVIMSDRRRVSAVHERPGRRGVGRTMERRRWLGGGGRKLGEGNCYWCN